MFELLPNVAVPALFATGSYCRCPLLFPAAFSTSGAHGHAVAHGCQALWQVSLLHWSLSSLGIFVPALVLSEVSAGKDFLQIEVM